MLGKLRRKFIALNMAIAAGVLLVAFATVCAVNYQQELQAVQADLAASLDRAMSDEGLADPASTPSASGEAGSPEADGLLSGPPPQIGGQRGGGERQTPIALYRVSEDGTLEALDDAATASLSDEVLQQAAATLEDAPEGFGTLQSLGLHYQKRVAGGTACYAFADMSATSSWKGLIPLLCAVGLAAMLAFLLISILFSRWALKPVAQAWDAQRRFVADASHDLKTPLTVILANTAILEGCPEDTVGGQLQWVESTRQEAEGMKSLVNDLLLLAQLDEDARPPFERVDFSEVVDAELLQFESVVFERGLSPSSRIEPGLAVKGDAARLHRMVSTLLDNACKYADEGGAVEVALERRGRKAQLSVRNSGEPIPAEDLPHVFDRFYRADKARRRTEGGHGLGLAIARSIVQEHGGTLEAASSREAGTVFTATLPLAEGPGT